MHRLLIHTQLGLQDTYSNCFSGLELPESDRIRFETLIGMQGTASTQKERVDHALLTRTRAFERTG